MLFDLDGVLLDSEPLRSRIARAMLATEGHEVPEEVGRAYLGRDAREIWEDLCRRFGLRHPPAYYDERFGAEVLKALEAPIEPQPGVRQVLAWLQARRVPRALASSSARPWIEASLRAIGLSEAFSVVVAGPDVPRGKPAPDIFLLAARRLGVAPDRCLVIEDSPLGVQAGRAAGMAVLAVRTAQTRGHPFGEATWVVDSLEDVLEAAPAGSSHAKALVRDDAHRR